MKNIIEFSQPNDDQENEKIFIIADMYLNHSTSLNDAFIKIGFHIDEFQVRYNGVLVGYSFPKHSFKTHLLKFFRLDPKPSTTQTILPDEIFYNVETNKLYFIEKMFHNASKKELYSLQSSFYKKWYYSRLFSNINIKLEHIYILGDIYKNQKYNDLLINIEMEGCRYYFNTLSTSQIGI